ncbi:hypothetical protein AR158_c495L [Paramecium bursaria Chlorella virus AR158]|uniref:hypothetical protein n=1 Tax=Paramecium bursaria Chlorella virus AR158 TaxID=380598 RepID=UPI00015AA706|nr:hypothetical protein AR158_c495L [Paramecium bursaria Chlorella virus AR158]ABU44040.1 hypothetical protein AR158_c495L [Paramecium bursaria Chlorella virus AR158]
MTSSALISFAFPNPSESGKPSSFKLYTIPACAIFSVVDVIFSLTRSQSIEAIGWIPTTISCLDDHAFIAKGPGTPADHLITNIPENSFDLYRSEIASFILL